MTKLHWKKSVRGTLPGAEAMRPRRLALLVSAVVVFLALGIGLTGDAAAQATCGNGTPDGGEQCDLGANNGQPGFCCSVTCTYEPSTTLCDAGSGDVCDPDEYCTGLSDTCPADTVSPTSTECYAGSADVCDPSKFCTGVADQACPAPTTQPSTFECNAGSGDVCDPSEYCTGTAGQTCPADNFEPSSYMCRPGSGNPNGGSICDPDDYCTGVADQPCPPNTFEPSSFVCNPGSGNPNGGTVCDPDETCPGVAGQPCPVDSFEPTSFVCNPGSGNPNGGIVCDPDETCPGVADQACPVDVPVPAGTLCRPTLGECDINEECDGVPDSPCPVNLFEADDTACYTEPPISREPHYPLPTRTLPCDSGDCVCASGYCTAPGSLALSQGRLNANKPGSPKPKGSGRGIFGVFDDDTMVVEPGGDLRAQLLAGTVAVVMSDGGNFNVTEPLGTCIEKGLQISCKTDNAKAIFRRNEGLDAIWRVKIRLRRLPESDTGSGTLNPVYSLSLLQPDQFYQVVRTDVLTTNCSVRGRGLKCTEE